MPRYTLGTRGAKLASVLLGGTQVGWYAVVVGTIGDLTAEALGWDSYGARAAVMIVISALMCATACWGHHGIYWVSLVSTPLILILAFWVLARSPQEAGGVSGLAGVEPTTSMALAVAVTTVVGTFVSAGTQAPIWTRFARRGSHAVGACVIGFLVGNGLMIFFGAVGARTFGEGDFVLVLYRLGPVRSRTLVPGPGTRAPRRAQLATRQALGLTARQRGGWRERGRPLTSRAAGPAPAHA